MNHIIQNKNITQDMTSLNDPVNVYYPWLWYIEITRQTYKAIYETKHSLSLSPFSNNQNKQIIMQIVNGFWILLFFCYYTLVRFEVNSIVVPNKKMSNLRRNRKCKMEDFQNG